MLPSHTLLLALATGAVAYKNAFIIEEKPDWAQLDKTMLQATLRCTVTPRRTFNAPDFRGQSFDVDCDKAQYKGDDKTTTKELLKLLKSVDSVAKAWEVQVSMPHPSPDKDTSPFFGGTRSKRKRSVKKRQDPGTSDPPPPLQPFAPHVSTGVDKAHAAGITGKGKKIAIIDDGFNFENVAGLKKTSITWQENLVDRSNFLVSDDCSFHGTHILGTLGANSDDKQFGVVGVAPEASYELYKIQACTGGAPNDRQIEALLLAVERKVDVISMSIGGYLAYPEDPVSALIARIHKNGIFVAISQGNGGPGVFTGASPGGADLISSTGSTDSATTPINTWRGEVSDKTDFRYVPGSPQKLPFGKPPFQLWFPADAEKLNTPRNRCVPLPKDTPLPKDPANTVMMIDYLHCWNDPATDKPITAALGIKHVLYYQPADYSGEEWGLQFWQAFSSDELDGVALISNEKAQELAGKLAKDPTLSVSFPEKVDHKIEFVNNTITGDSMSIFSSWGPTADGRLSPGISAPGGNILSTFPKGLGEWGVISGTSQATPFIAGVAALLQQKFADAKISPAEIQNIMALTAKPLQYNDGKQKADILAPIFQQGAGMVDVFKAINTPTRVDVMALNFNDTDNRPSALKFKLRNSGGETIDYKIGHLGGPSGYIFEPMGQGLDYVKTRHEARDVSAQLTITPATVTLGPKAEAEITVSVTANPELGEAEERGVTFGGFISIDSGKEMLTVPYSGLGSSMKKLPMVDRNITQLVRANESVVTPFQNGDELKEPLFDCFYNTTAEIPLECPDGFSGIRVGYALPCREFAFDIINADTKEDAIPLVLRGDSERIWTPGQYWYWDGTDGNYTFLQPGRYQWRVGALRWGGQEKVSDDWDVWDSPVWKLTYKEGSSFPK